MRCTTTGAFAESISGRCTLGTIKYVFSLTLRPCLLLQILYSFLLRGPWLTRLFEQWRCARKSLRVFVLQLETQGPEGCAGYGDIA